MTLNDPERLNSPYFAIFAEYGWILGNFAAIRAKSPMLMVINFKN